MEKEIIITYKEEKILWQGKVLNKVMGFLGLEDEYEYEEYYDDENEVEDSDEATEFEPIVHSTKTGKSCKYTFNIHTKGFNCKT